MAVERNTSLDSLRILACLGVITIHTAGSPIYHNMVEVGSLWFNECLVFYALVRWSVPVFAMLTGYFLLDTQKELPIKKLLTKYIPRIVIALVLWSAFYAITLHKPLLPFGSQEGHFWYMGMLVGLYLSLPILRLIVTNRTILAYFCWTWLFFMCYRFVGNFCTLPFSFDSVIFVDFAGYALWGVYCKEFFAQSDKTLLPLLIGGGITITVSTVYKQDTNSAFFSYTSPNVIASTVAIFYLFISHNWQYPNWLKRTIAVVSECTFGIYLIHLWILIQVFFRVHRFIEQPILLTIICVGMAFCGGLVVTYLLKKIPYVNKFIC